jgi:hypothetical protein
MGSENTDTFQVVRVHIDGKRLELDSSISGQALYHAAHVAQDEVLYRETSGDREDHLIPRDQPEIRLEQDEHFYTSSPHKPEHTILVNARRKTVQGKKISFAQVVKLAFPGGPPSPETIYTVAYTNGPPKNPKGTMVEGQTVHIQEEMSFDVTEAGRS